jgi:hypothetical protein
MTPAPHTSARPASHEPVPSPDHDGHVDAVVQNAWRGDGPRTGTQILAAAQAVVDGTDPDTLNRWLRDNAVTLIAQQLLVASVHSQQHVEARVSTILVTSDTDDPATIVERLIEEYPGLLRAWLMQQAVPLVAARVAGHSAASPPSGP